MDRNLLLATALSMLVFTLWQAFMAQQHDEPVTQEAAISESVESTDSAEALASDSERDWASTNDAKESAASALAMREPAASAPSSPGDTPSDRPEELISVGGELTTGVLSSRGGVIKSWKLTKYESDGRRGGEPTELINYDDSLARALQTPFEDLGLGDLSNAIYEVESKSKSDVVFVLRRGGLVIRKEYSFEFSEYYFGLSVTVENTSTGVVAPKFTLQWPAVADHEDQDFSEQAFIVRSADDVTRELIAGIGSPGFFGKMFGNASPDGRSEFRDGVDWAGVELKYFVSVVLPEEPRNARAMIEPVVKNEVGLLSVNISPVSLAPGESATEHFTVYMGPKEVDRLEALGSDLLQTINLGYSWFHPLTMFFRWLLPWCYGFVGNYGVAIILITLAVRLITAPIMARQMKSMERMRELQPRMKEIQEKHKDDKQKQSEATMALYKETGVNPLGGCLPMLLQFPVFIGLFFALQSSIELRHAPFALWISDLSSPEQLFVIPGIDLPIRLLPLIMGGSMVIQQRMTPMTGMDPAQAKMMMIVMPIMMTVLFYQFPSGLVLYWMMSNLLGIAHQLWVRRNLAAAAAA